VRRKKKKKIRIEIGESRRHCSSNPASPRAPHFVEGRGANQGTTEARLGPPYSVPRPEAGFRQDAVSRLAAEKFASERAAGLTWCQRRFKLVGIDLPLDLEPQDQPARPWAGTRLSEVAVDAKPLPSWPLETRWKRGPLRQCSRNVSRPVERIGTMTISSTRRGIDSPASGGIAASARPRKEGGLEFAFCGPEAVFPRNIRDPWGEVSSGRPPSLRGEGRNAVRERNVPGGGQPRRCIGIGDAGPQGTARWSPFFPRPRGPNGGDVPFC